MSAFNRRFEPSRLLFLPPLCWVGIVLSVFGLLVMSTLSITSIRVLGLMLLVGGVLMALFCWRYRHDAALLKTYQENRLDRQATAFGVRKGMTE